MHNLKGIDLDIPHGQWIAICGLSGSGKTSLALDTLYAEGQRRYMESLSPYTRQFLQQLDKPEADRIDGIPPAVAVQRQKGKSGARSTVGSLTETNDYLQILFSQIGSVVCSHCDLPVVADTPASILVRLESVDEAARFQIGFEVKSSDPVHCRDELLSAKRNGFGRAIVNGTTVDLREFDSLEMNALEDVWVIVDRLTGKSSEQRILDSLESAFNFGDACCLAIIDSEISGSTSTVVDGKQCWLAKFSRAMICTHCNTRYAKPEPRNFSSNNALGACPKCEGFGSVARLDRDLIVPDPSVSIEDGAIEPWNSPAYKHELEELLALADDYELPVEVPFSQLNAKQVQLIWEGVPEREFGGLNGFFEWLRKRTYKIPVAVFLSRWRSYEKCLSCDGAKLNSVSRCFHVKGRTLPQLMSLSISEVCEFFEDLNLNLYQSKFVAPTLKQIRQRVKYLCNVGLGYLSLNRPASTLSGGESQRVALTTSLSSTLVNMLYVLDEPSVGLHPHDVGALTEAIRGLNARGNTVIAVDHEFDMIENAERVIEIGPGAGTSGGEIVFDGTVSELKKKGNSLTGDYLAGRLGVSSAMVDVARVEVG